MFAAQLALLLKPYRYRVFFLMAIVEFMLGVNDLRNRCPYFIDLGLELAIDFSRQGTTIRAKLFGEFRGDFGVLIPFS